MVIRSHSFSWTLSLQSTKALANFAQLATLADGVILARGGLGKLVSPEKMALLQKRVIARCNALGKLCIVARIMDSMGQSPRPTRAEATDVANSVMDGADGFLLGAQTTCGRYPVECVKSTLGICREAERFFDFDAHFERVIALLREVRFFTSDFADNRMLPGVDGALLHELSCRTAYCEIFCLIKCL
jgi:pyruvate kinase